MRFLRSIYLAVALLVVTVGLNAYVESRSDTMHSLHREVGTGLERMVRLSDNLHAMLVMAVLERNGLRVASFETLSAELDATVRDVETLTVDLSLSGEMASLREGLDRLRVTARQAVALILSDEWEAARSVLFDESFVMSRKMYEIHSETVVGALTGELAAMTKRHDRLRLAAQAMWLGALLLLLWVGGRYSNRLRTELAEQARLREAVSAANEALEEKVRLRTLELQALNDQLKALSATDGLTGLANRRRFDSVWELERQRARRHGTSLGVVMMDVDHFKAYNDHYGHLAGDDCLQRVARVLEGAGRRAGELVARYGGEEFVVLLPGADVQEARAAGERIRASVEAQQLAHAHSATAAVVTVSIGVAAWPPGDQEPDDALIAAADAALYEAKRTGRNRVVVADPFASPRQT